MRDMLVNLQSVRRWWQFWQGLQRVRFIFSALFSPTRPSFSSYAPMPRLGNNGSFVLVQYKLTRCYLCYSVEKRTGHAVAIKVIDIESAEDEVDDIIQEIAILSELQSPYVTKYYGSYAKGAELWIVMEFCSGGSCADLMKPGKIEEEYIAIIVRELLLGLDYLHTDKKLHRDVKGRSNSQRLCRTQGRQHARHWWCAVLM